MRDGIILIDKPTGISSAGVVARVKRVLNAQRVGHAGTLDPDATGLLIVLVNGATRVASYAADGFKVYSGEMQLGVATTSDDISGEVLSRSEVSCSWNELLVQARKLTGVVDQVPPTVSAKKIGGKRAYRLHREGHEVQLLARKVEVRRFEVTPVEQRSDTVRYCVDVSPGTYVRALARDLGAALGCGGTVVSIRRESSGCFRVDDACTLDQISWEMVRDWGELVPDIPRLALSPQIVGALIQGQRSALPDAWKEWCANRVEALPTHVLYLRSGSVESVGILKVIPNGGFDFGLNIARQVPK